jgi:hypothetical protein
MDLLDVAQDRDRCEHCNEHSGYIKWWEGLV